MLPKDSTIYQPLEHPFRWPQAGDSVTFLRGPLLLEYPSGEGCDQTGPGELRLTWGRRPRATWVLAPYGNEDSAVSFGPSWPSHVRPLEAATLMLQQSRAQSGVHVLSGPVNAPVALGDPEQVDSVAFFLINGRKVDSLKRIAMDGSWYRGRLDIQHAEWDILIDQTPHESVFKELASETVGHAATHLCRISRRDGGTFNALETAPIMEGVASVFSFAACRTVAPTMLVASRGRQSCWAKLWTPASDEWTGAFTWLDPSYGFQQLAELIPLWLDIWANPEDRQTLKLATAYHGTACKSVPLEPSLAFAISGLLLIGDAERRKRGIGGSEWGKEANRQIRKLLKFASIDAAPVTHYPHLTAISVAKHEKIMQGNSTQQPQPRAADFIDGIVDLRNVIVHPDVTNRARVDWNGLRQAWRTATEWLDLAILFHVGYRGTYAPRCREHLRWAGDVQQVPWAM